MVDMEGHERLLTTAEVARIFRVDVKTIWRWTRTGKLAVTHTPSGRPRYRESEIRALLATPDDRPGVPPPPPRPGPVPEQE